jgi:hypothetical protein
MAGTPISLTLYDPETDEVIQTYTRSFVPWKLLKTAVRLSTALDKHPEEMTEEQIDELAQLVVDVFGERFSLEQVTNGADLTEMMAVITQIIAKARGSVPNGHLPEKPRKVTRQMPTG